MTEHVLFPLFVLNTVLVLAAAAMGYHLAPRLMARINEPEQHELAVRSTRRMLSAVVTLYMFFNCVGFFTARNGWLIAVLVLVCIDIGLQLWLTRSRQEPPDGGEDRW